MTIWTIRLLHALRTLRSQATKVLAVLQQSNLHLLAELCLTKAIH